MSVVLAIDPGDERSGWALLDVSTRRVEASCPDTPNGDLVDWLTPHRPAATPDALQAWAGQSNPTLIIERVEPFGLSVGLEVFETAYWTGRFAEAACHHRASVHRIGRREVKVQLCGTVRANDSSIYHALLDRFGGRAAAKGNAKAPGPVYGVSRDGWSALAVAVAYAEMCMGVTGWQSGSISDGST